MSTEPSARALALLKRHHRAAVDCGAAIDASAHPPRTFIARLGRLERDEAAVLAYIAQLEQERRILRGHVVKLADSVIDLYALLGDTNDDDAHRRLWRDRACKRRAAALADLKQ
jgi:hypothetical protein